MSDPDEGPLDYLDDDPDESKIDEDDCEDRANAAREEARWGAFGCGGLVGFTLAMLLVYMGWCNPR